jgi:CoA-dependent NAD(P)H sulfur oxidoreductase
VVNIIYIYTQRIEAALMYPLSSQKNIIVIGGNAAGPAAAAKAKRTAPDANVLMIEAGSFISTGTCELPYVLSEEIKNYEDIVFFNAQSFEKEKGVKVLTKHLVEKIELSKKIIIVKNIISGHTFQQEYNKLILCTGSIAKTIPSLPKDLKNVFTLKSVTNLLALKEYLISNNAKNILIVGAGYIGLESADALKTLGYSVTIIEKEKLPLPGFDDEARYLLKTLLEKNGIEFYGSVSNLSFKHNAEKFLSIKHEGRIREYDLILVAAGVEPNNSLVVASKLDIGKYGGIKVDNKLRTSDSHIYAAGDCTEVINKITSQSDYIPLATLAQQYGHIAGENAAGGNEVVQPVIKNIAVQLFGKVYVSVGLNSLEAKKYSFNFSSVSKIVPNLVKVMPNSEQVFGKIIFEKNTKQIIGANFVGSKETIGYGDLVTSFIHNKIKVTELAKINFNYTPPLSPFINILSVLGKKIERHK